MGIIQYNLAKGLIEANANLISDCGGGCAEFTEKVEKVLDLKFPKEYKIFLLDYGTLTFGSEEIYGIFRDDFETSGIPDAVWITLEERKTSAMPHFLVILTDDGMGNYFCLNFSILNEENEPKVTLYTPGYKESEQPYEIMADSFGHFLLYTIHNEIALNRGKK